MNITDSQAIVWSVATRIFGAVGVVLVEEPSMSDIPPQFAPSELHGWQQSLGGIDTISCVIIENAIVTVLGVEPKRRDFPYP